MRISDWSSDVLFRSEPAFSTRSGAAAGDDGEHSLEQRLSDTVSLRQHLTEQLHIETADPTERAIGACLIDQLDDNGYLSGDLTALAEHLGCSLTRVEAEIGRAQRLNSSH